MRTWIFQGNPEVFDIEGYLAASSGLITWTVARYADQISPGDSVYIWRSQGQDAAQAGILAEGTITEYPRVQKDDALSADFWKKAPALEEAVRVKIRLNRIASKKEVLKREWMKDDSVLRNMLIMKQAAGTTFPVDEQESKRLQQLWSKTGTDWERDEVVAAHEQLPDEPISKVAGSKVDARSLKECLERVLQNYLKATQEPFEQHPLAKFIRHEFRDAVALTIRDTDRLIVKGSAGQSVWVRSPWVAIFDPIKTTSAQTGYNVGYAFREDMLGVYLSLMQGYTDVRADYKADAKDALRARAAHFRAMLGSQVSLYPEESIHLAPSSPSNNATFAEAGNICAKYYPAGELPTEAQLAADVRGMVDLYEMLIEADAAASDGAEGDEPPDLDVEDASKFRLHRRIERNARLAAKVKKVQGCTCQVCGMNFEERYGSVGKNFIEAHHLMPLVTLKGRKITLHPAKDFAVLCSNCHRMLHRSGYVDNLQRFREEHYRG